MARSVPISSAVGVGASQDQRERHAGGSIQSLRVRDRRTVGADDIDVHSRRSRFTEAILDDKLKEVQAGVILI